MVRGEGSGNANYYYYYDHYSHKEYRKMAVDNHSGNMQQIYLNPNLLTHLIYTRKTWRLSLK